MTPKRIDFFNTIKAKGCMLSKNCFLLRNKKKFFVLKGSRLYKFKASELIDKEKYEEAFSEDELKSLQCKINTLYLPYEDIIEEKECIVEDYREYGILRFPSLNNITLDCKISLGSNSKTEFVLAQPFQKNDEKYVCFFGESMPQYAKPIQAEEYSVQLYQYTTKVNNVTYTLFSEKEILDSSIRIKGTIVTASDKVKIGTESHSETTKKNFVFVNEVEPRTINKKDLKEACKLIKSVNDLQNEYFLFFRQPDEFEKVILAWNIHNVPDNNYPLHLNLISTPGLGKSDLLERIAEVNGLKQENIFTGSENTPKGLYPSYRGDYVKPGYLLDQENIAIVDEIYEMLGRVQRTSEKDELFNKLRELFEWKQRVLKSGNTQDSISRPTFRAILAGNPPELWINSTQKKVGKNMDDLICIIDRAWLMRVWTIFYTPQHKKMIEENKLKVQKGKNFINTKKKLKLDSYLKALAKIKIVFNEEDLEKINSLFLNQVNNPFFKNKFNEETKEIYFQRGLHHLLCITDGICKLNRLQEIEKYLILATKSKEKSIELPIKLTEQDLSEVKKIVHYTLESWFDVYYEENIKQLFN